MFNNGKATSDAEGTSGVDVRLCSWIRPVGWDYTSLMAS